MSWGFVVTPGPPSKPLPLQPASMVSAGQASVWLCPSFTASCSLRLLLWMAHTVLRPFAFDALSCSIGSTAASEPALALLRPVRVDTECTNAAFVEQLLQWLPSHQGRFRLLRCSWAKDRFKLALGVPDYIPSLSQVHTLHSVSVDPTSSAAGCQSPWHTPGSRCARHSNPLLCPSCLALKNNDRQPLERQRCRLRARRSLQL